MWKAVIIIRERSFRRILEQIVQLAFNAPSDRAQSARHCCDQDFCRPVSRLLVRFPMYNAAESTPKRLSRLFCSICRSVGSNKPKSRHRRSERIKRTVNQQLKSERHFNFSTLKRVPLVWRLFCPLSIFGEKFALHSNGRY